MSTADQAAEDNLYARFTKDIFDQVIVSGQISPEVVTHIAEKFMKGVQEGYGQNLSKIAYDTPDYNMIANLRKNVYQFSTAKNYQQVRELNDLLRDGDRLREWPEYKTEARKILGEYNRYEKTEYSAAVAGSQMAGKWVGFQESAEDMPYLMYETVGDSHVRDDHRKLDKVVKLITDSFWKKYYPPNGWNCRCTVIQLTTKAHETPNKNIEYPEIPKLWQVNTAEQNIIFSPDSPYFIGIPKDVLKQHFDLLPYEDRYITIYKGKTGGFVNQHIDVNEDKTDYKIVSKIAKEKADKGHIIHILPEIKSPDDPRRKLTLKGAKYGKNPDLRIDGQYVEVKDPKSNNTLMKRIHESATQADIAIINTTQEYEISDKSARKIFTEKKQLKSFEIRVKGKYSSYKREDYIK